MKMLSGCMRLFGYNIRHITLIQTAVKAARSSSKKEQSLQKTEFSID